MKTEGTHDLTRTTLAILSIGVLIAASFWILRPLLTAVVWAAIIVIATWPILLTFQKWFWGKRSLAVTAMTIILLLILLIPMVIGIAAVTNKVGDISTWSESLSTFTVPPPPAWVGSIPLIGKKISGQWQSYAALSPQELLALVGPYTRAVASWFVARIGSLLGVILQFLLTVIVAAVMYGTGETAGRGILAFMRRLAGQRGEEITILAEKAIRSVALGIVVTALIQTVISAIGLAAMGIPGAAVLTVVVFVCCLVQIGPILVLIPSVIWLYSQGDPIRGTLLLIISVVALAIDNFLRPVLIKKGADLPLLLIFAGVIGGVMAFGVVGLFIGPVVLAVTYTLLQSWVSEGSLAANTRRS